MYLLCFRLVFDFTVTFRPKFLFQEPYLRSFQNNYSSCCLKIFIATCFAYIFIEQFSGMQVRRPDSVKSFILLMFYQYCRNHAELEQACYTRSQKCLKLFLSNYRQRMKLWSSSVKSFKFWIIKINSSFYMWDYFCLFI